MIRASNARPVTSGVRESQDTSEIQDRQAPFGPDRLEYKDGVLTVAVPVPETATRTIPVRAA